MIKELEDLISLAKTLIDEYGDQFESEIVIDIDRVERLATGTVIAKMTARIKPKKKEAPKE